MSIQQTIQDVTALFEDIDRQTKAFAQASGLSCHNSCGACCENPHIETTIAEMLPLAAHLWAQGEAEPILKKMAAQDAQDVCVFYLPQAGRPGHGRCSIYGHRPGLCRLFGFAARRDKYGKTSLLTCKIIKESQPQACTKTQAQLDSGLQAPFLSAYTSRVAGIDPTHGSALMPIRQATHLALEKVGYALEKSHGQMYTKNNDT